MVPGRIKQLSEDECLFLQAELRAVNHSVFVMEVLLIRQERNPSFKTHLNAIKYFISRLAGGLRGLEKQSISLRAQNYMPADTFFFLHWSVQEKETFFLEVWCLQDTSTAQL